MRDFLRALALLPITTWLAAVDRDAHAMTIADIDVLNHVLREHELTSAGRAAEDAVAQLAEPMRRAATAAGVALETVNVAQTLAEWCARALVAGPLLPDAVFGTLTAPFAPYLEEEAPPPS